MEKNEKFQLISAVNEGIVDNLENKDYLSFLETTAANSGWEMKWFIDIESARTGLKNIL